MGIARFEKVSFAQFAADWKNHFPETTEVALRAAYDALQLPKRATGGSAGYDFKAPAAIAIPHQSGVLVPTGIRVLMDSRYVLMLFPRSGLGSRYRLQLNNTVGIIDSDYYQAANEGHILCPLYNDSREKKDLVLSAGVGMLQGIFVPFGIAEDDGAFGVRSGGFGSTDQDK